MTYSCSLTGREGYSVPLFGLFTRIPRTIEEEEPECKLIRMTLGFVHNKLEVEHTFEQGLELVRPITVTDVFDKPLCDGWGCGTAAPAFLCSEEIIPERITRLVAHLILLFAKARIALLDLFS